MRSHSFATNKTTLLLWLAALAGFFYLAPPAAAYELDISPTSLTSQGLNNSSSFVQTFTAPVSGVLTDVIPYGIAKNGGSTQPACWYVDAVGSGPSNCSHTISITDSPPAVYSQDFTWVSPITVVAGQKYTLSLSVGGFGASWLMYGDSNDIYSGGQAGTSTNAGTTVTSGVVKDVGFKIIIDNGTSFGSAIYWYATPTSTCDFQTWQTVAVVSSTDITSIFNGAIVRWGIATDTMINVDTLSASTGIGTSSPNYAYAPNGGVKKNTPLVPGFTYYAQALYTNDLANVRSSGYVDMTKVVASSSVWSFIIAGYGGQNTCSVASKIYADSTWPTSSGFVYQPAPSGCVDNVDYCSGITSSTGFWADGSKAVCQAAQLLFRPSCAAVSQFIGLENTLANKPPFGYFSVYSNQLAVIEGVTTTSSTIATSSILLGAAIMTASFSFFQQLLVVGGVILNLAGVFYIYHRFKHFKFN